MLNRLQLEDALSLSYPQEISLLTQNKRKNNINSLMKLIGDSINESGLVYGDREERLILYTTLAGEQVTIQYPGQESVISDGKKYNPYDFRPRIILPGGDIIRDLTFADMWSIVERVNSDYKGLTKSLSALFFRMGRMIDYEYVTENYSYDVIDIDSDSKIVSGKRSLSWYKFSLDLEIIESLNHEIMTIPIDNDREISFEAFLYFFSLILENEDIKYHCRKKDLSSGRLPTSDSMLLLAAYFSGAISLSTLLQKYVSGFGVGKCVASEIGPATSGLIRIIDCKQEIIDLLTEHNIQYKRNSNITVNGRSIGVLIKVPLYRVAILNKPDDDKRDFLSNGQWEVFDVETALFEDTNYNRMLRYLGIEHSDGSVL